MSIGTRLRNWWRTITDDDAMEVGVVPYPLHRELAPRYVGILPCFDAPPPEPEEVDFGTVGEFLAACLEVRPDLTGKRIIWRTNDFFNYRHELLVLREAVKPKGEPRSWIVRVIESQGANVSGGWDRVPGEFQKGAEGAMDERYLLYRMEHKGGSYPHPDSLTYAKFMERIAEQERRAAQRTIPQAS